MPRGGRGEGEGGCVTNNNGGKTGLMVELRLHKTLYQWLVQLLHEFIHPSFDHSYDKDTMEFKPV